MSTSPPTDDELDQLEALLIRLDKRGFMLSDADGYLCAIALSPDPIPEAEWQADLFEAHDCEPSPGEIREMADVASRRITEILTTLETDPGSFAPIVELDTDESPLSEIWAEGFLAGMGRRPEAWQQLLDHPTGQLVLMPILMLGDPRALEAAFPKRGKRERERDRLAANLPDLVGFLFTLTQTLKSDGLAALPSPEEFAASISPEPDHPPQKTAGRNDPCPCGSGKKYKKCCGAPAAAPV